MTNPFGDWGLMDRIILRECEFRLRNADALRGTLAKRLRAISAEYKVKPWAEVRVMATEALVEAEALVDEYRAIIKEVMATKIPATELDGHARRTVVATHSADALEIMEQAPAAIRKMIDEEDEKVTSSRPSSTSE